jgi:hypothetical protein
VEEWEAAFQLLDSPFRVQDHPRPTVEGTLLVIRRGTSLDPV